MNVVGRWQRSLDQRGLGGTLAQIPRAALRPLLLAVRTCRARQQAPRLVTATHPALLHLGSGPDRRPGWINVDLYFPAELCLDLTRPLPLPDGCVDAIYSQHFVEHLTQPQTFALLQECARVLKPGGWLRVATPDLAQCVQRWQQHSQAGTPGTLAADELNEALRSHDHLYIYDYAALSDLLLRAGLVDLRRAQPQESECEYLRGLDNRQAVTTSPAPSPDLIIEARRPE